MDLRHRLLRLLVLHQGEERIVLFLFMVAALAGFGLSIGRDSSGALFFTLFGVDHLSLMFALIAYGHSVKISTVAPSPSFIPPTLHEATQAG